MISVRAVSLRRTAIIFGAVSNRLNQKRRRAHGGVMVFALVLSRIASNWQIEKTIVKLYSKQH